MQYFSTIVVGIMTAFALVGIIDQLFLKNRLGLGPSRGDMRPPPR